MSDRPGVVELDAEKMRALLDELDERLRDRGIAASIYLVGGAAMALEYGRESLTPDIDAITSHAAVFEEAGDMATKHGLSDRWLNASAAPWVPPQPDGATERPTRKGLTVHVAPAQHVLAMKLVSLRRKDRPDIRRLIEHCDMVSASAEEYADLMAAIYTGEGLLAQALGVPGGDDDAARSEALAIGRWAHDFARSFRDAGR